MKISTAMRAVAAAIATLTLTLASASEAQSEPVFSTGPKFQQTSGEGIFRAICQGCHMPQAQGAIGAGKYPALASNTRLTSPEYPLYVVLHGQKGMPEFSTLLDDNQVAAVVTYVRSHFGNNFADAISAEHVAKLRQ